MLFVGGVISSIWLMICVIWWDQFPPVYLLLAGNYTFFLFGGISFLPIPFLTGNYGGLFVFFGGFLFVSLVANNYGIRFFYKVQ